eukprot:14951-Heterococcus_DN1.PRE.3
MAEKLVIAGATGGLGRRCVYHALTDARVGSVTAIMRSSPKPAAFYGLADSQQAEFSKLKQVTVDFTNLDASASAFAGCTAGISCLGVYSSEMKDYTMFMQREHAPNLKVASLAAAGGASAWAYLSGQGVKQPPITQLKPTALQPMFSFVKGSVERDLGGVPGFTRGVTAVRPGMILGRKGVYNEHLENFVNGRFGSWLGNTAFAVQSDDIARAL